MNREFSEVPFFYLLASFSEKFANKYLTRPHFRAGDFVAQLKEVYPRLILIGRSKFMKPAIIPHADHKRILRSRLDEYFPDKSIIPKEIAPIYRKFRDLDLSAVDRIMQPHYSIVGPVP